MYVDGANGEGGVLFDPGGSFRASDGGSGTYRNSNTFYEADGQNLFQEFVDYETRDDDQTVSVISLFTDDATDQSIIGQIEGDEGPQAPMDCASACSRVARGVLPKAGKHSLFPGTLRNRAQKEAQSTGGLDRTYTGDEDSTGRQQASSNRLIYPKEERD